MEKEKIIEILDKYSWDFKGKIVVDGDDFESIAVEILELQTKECEHPYCFVYRKADFEKCTKCGKILFEG